MKKIPTPIRDSLKPPRMRVVRSFDVNKPGTVIEDIVGGVIGGTIFQGTFKTGNELEIRPGIPSLQGKSGSYKTLFTKIVSLYTGGRQVDEAYGGGLVGVGTLLDPSYSKADGLSGNIAGKTDSLPPIMSELSMETHVLERAVGTKEQTKVKRINLNEILLLHVGSAVNIGKVIVAKPNSVKVKLTRPICAIIGSRVSISRKITSRWRLIGYGIITG